MTKICAIAGALTMVMAGCATETVPAIRQGMVVYGGSQKTMFETGKSEARVPLAAMSGDAATFGVGAVAGLDGEITVIEGRPYVTRVRGDGFTLDQGQDHVAAAYAVWTTQNRWASEAVPSDVTTYLELQRFVKARATAAGIDVDQPFPFLLEGTPVELKWHINVDRTEGKPITPDLFAKSKAIYLMRNEPVDIVGFYSERHSGIFISDLAPGLEGTDVKNALHAHMISRDGKAAGHIDDIVLAGGMTLRLPTN